MKRLFLGAAALATMAVSAPASAGVYGDDATRCMIKSTTEADQLALIKWIFAGVAAHPSIKEYSNINAEQRAQLDRQMGVLVTRLLTQDCRKAVVDAIKYEGTGFLENSFGSLSETAMTGLTTNPEVSTALTKWASPEIVATFGALAVEAGRAPPPKP